MAEDTKKDVKKDEIKNNDVKKDDVKEESSKIEIQKLLGTQLTILNVNNGQMEVIDVDKSTTNQRILKTINCVNMMIGLKIDEKLNFPLFILQRGTDSTYINIIRV